MVKSLETTDKYPSVTKLMRFVSEAAREVNDPVFGVPESKSRDFGGRDLHKPKGAEEQVLECKLMSLVKAQDVGAVAMIGKLKDAKIKLCVCRLCRGDRDLSVCTV